MPSPRPTKPEEHKTQADKVKETLQDISTAQRLPITEKVHRPGLNKLSFDEKAEVFINVMKSRSNMISFTYSAGTDYIEVVSISDLKIS